MTVSGTTGGTRPGHDQPVFPPWPSYTEEEADALRQVLLSNKVNYWTGNQGRSFEREFAQWAGARHAVALANGTLALEIALRAAGVRSGDEVVVTPRSFVASASCILALGAVPVFAEVDRDSQNITAESVQPVLTGRTRAIVCVHLAGWPCDMDPIMALAEEYGLAVVEDCAQAHGARYRGRPVGSIGRAAAWSFCQDKIITTGGEGGMVTTGHKDLRDAVWSYKDHGKNREAVFAKEHPPGYRWVHEALGTNARLTEGQAAVGRIQLSRMSRWHALRTRNAGLLTDRIVDLPGLRIPVPPEHVDHAWYRYYVFVEPGSLRAGWDRDRIMQAVTGEGVPCFTGACPELYREKVFRDRGLAPREPLPVAAELGRTSLAFLVHPTLGEVEMARTGEALEKVLRQAVR